MADCPNCAADVEQGVRLCPACGFDTGESQADAVRALRDAGRIHPGRLNAGDPAGPVATPSGDANETAMPAEDNGAKDPREISGGL